MTTAQIQIPKKLIPVFAAKNMRYRGAYGGRGSAKTRTFALMTAITAYKCAEENKSGVILCGREFMNSLSDSSMEEVKQAIRSVDWLNDYFDIGENYIRTKCRKVSYVFCGLRHNLDSIKSKARILLAWIDEAESVSEIAWQKLLPTVREENSEVWVTWNPEKEGSATDKRFRQSELEQSIIVEINYSDNPWFPDVLELERRNDQLNLDTETYQWIWEGAYRKNGKACVFSGKYIIEEFNPDKSWGRPMQGLDFGFSNDPTAGVRLWVNNDNLYIGYEAYKVGLELDDTEPYLNKHIPNFNEYRTIADNARPESISHLRKHGITKIEACQKGKGSVEDGIMFMKSFKKIIIHPRCVNVKKEFQTYSYKVDRITEEVTTELVDANNHAIDAIRYGLEPLMKRGKTAWDVM